VGVLRRGCDGPQPGPAGSLRGCGLARCGFARADGRARAFHARDGPHPLFASGARQVVQRAPARPARGRRTPRAGAGARAADGRGPVGRPARTGVGRGRAAASSCKRSFSAAGPGRPATPQPVRPGPASSRGRGRRCAPARFAREPDAPVAAALRGRARARRQLRAGSKTASTRAGRAAPGCRDRSPARARRPGARLPVGRTPQPGGLCAREARDLSTQGPSPAPARARGARVPGARARLPDGRAFLGAGADAASDSGSRRRRALAVGLDRLGRAGQRAPPGGRRRAGPRDARDRALRMAGLGRTAFRRCRTRLVPHVRPGEFRPANV
jgi:hypothetical protein